MNRTSFYTFSLSILLLLSSISDPVFADDPGITKVRLIQKSDTSYLLEADVPQNLLSLIKAPVFPPRFSLIDTELENQSGWITVKLSIVSSGDPLTVDEEILLPWLRNGVDFTVLWSDGSTYKGLFNRSLNGIHIPMKEVMPIHKTTVEVFKEAFVISVKHLGFKLIHPLFILVLAWYYRSRKAFSALLWYSLGQAASMIFIEVSNIQLDVLVADALLVILIFILAYTNLTKRELKFGWIALLICGLAHGLAYNSEIVALNLDAIQKVQSLFAFNLAIDIFQFSLLGLSIIAVKRFTVARRYQSWITKAFGGLAVCMMMLIFNENIWSGSNHILNLSDEKQSIAIPVASKPATGPVQRGAGMMVTPVMSFLSVEPYEIRQEILIRAGIGAMYIDPFTTSPIITISEQEQLKSELIKVIKEQSKLYIDGQGLEPAVETANFVKLSRGGVTVRETAVDEKKDESILGITLTYDITSIPDSIHWKWQFFPEGVDEIEVSIVDASGALTLMLGPNDHLVKWGNRLSNMKLPKVESVEVKKYPAPWISVSIFLVVFTWIVVQFYKKKRYKLDLWAKILLVIAFVCYPYIRTYSAVPFISDWKPSKERTNVILNDLITNVYRAFDRRKENDVYDRLSLSVTGDQLTEIYLQNRQAMALESRGGARARVDEVKILEVHRIGHAEEDGFTADAVWTVRGSVNHFGHTHYRQNKNRGLITFINDQDVWKISSIETIDEQRVY